MSRQAQVKNRTNVQRAERRLEALQMRRAGHTYAEIGEALGVNPSRAHAIVQTTLRNMLREPADDVRQMEDTRLDSMLRALWGRIEHGDVAAISAALRIMERRARLLGLDAPTQQQVVTEVQVVFTDDPVAESNAVAVEDHG